MSEGPGNRDMRRDKQSAYDDKKEMLSKELNCLEEAVGLILPSLIFTLLRERFSPVLRPVETKEVEKGDAESAESAAIEIVLGEAVERLNKISARLSVALDLCVL